MGLHQCRKLLGMWDWAGTPCPVILQEFVSRIPPPTWFSGLLGRLYDRMLVAPVIKAYHLGTVSTRHAYAVLVL